MRTLPFDHPRCLPQKTDSECKNCKRWYNHPDQKNNPLGQVCVTVKDHKDPACLYHPISLNPLEK
jgi:hypothetical protein